MPQPLPHPKLEAEPNRSNNNPYEVLLLLFLMVILFVSTKSICLVITVLPMVVILFMIFWQIVYRWEPFLRDSTLTQGVITQRWQTEDTDSEGNRQTHYYVTYTFPEGEATQTWVYERYYQQIKIGDPVTVRYMPSNPQRSLIEGL